MAKQPTNIRQEQIIDVALKIIHQNGLSGLSIRELSRQVELSEGAIYKHFASKDDIIKGVFNRIQLFGKTLFSELSNKNNPQEKLKHFIMFHFAMFQENPELITVLFSEELYDSTPALQKEFSLVISERQNHLKNILTEGINSKTFIEIDCDTIATMIQGFMRLTLTKWKRSGYKFTLKDQGNKLCSTLDLILKDRKSNIL